MQLLLNQSEFAKDSTMHGWILKMFFAELIRKDRSLIKTEIPLNDKNPELQKRPPRQPKTHHSNSNYFHLYVKRIVERDGCIYDSSNGDSCFVYKWLGFFQYISN